MNKLFGIDITKYSMENTVYISFWRYVGPVRENGSQAADYESFPIRTPQALKRIQRIIPPANAIKHVSRKQYPNGEYVSVDFILYTPESK
jgi:hypothetical protein